LEPLEEAEQGSTPLLRVHVERVTRDLQQKIESEFSTRFEKVLKQMNWPNQDMNMTESLEVDFDTSFDKLLDFQMPELQSHEDSNEVSTNPESPLVLLPLKIMVRPLELGFRYHFEGDRPTNRLERPEYFLNHITESFLDQYNDFMIERVQPLLLQQFRNTSLGLNPAYVDATSAFITALLPMVRNKLLTTLPKLSEPQLLSHLIHEVIKFDTTLREDWRYDDGSRGEPWKGLAGEILNQDEYFEKWLKVEKDCKFSAQLSEF
jgi:hypothetical protein